MPLGLKGIRIQEIRLSQEREQNRLFPIVAFSGTVFLGTAQLLFNLQNFKTLFLSHTVVTMSCLKKRKLRFIG